MGRKSRQCAWKTPPDAIPRVPLQDILDANPQAKFILDASTCTSESDEQRLAGEITVDGELAWDNVSGVIFSLVQDAYKLSDQQMAIHAGDGATVSAGEETPACVALPFFRESLLFSRQYMAISKTRCFTVATTAQTAVETVKATAATAVHIQMSSIYAVQYLLEGLGAWCKS